MHALLTFLIPITDTGFYIVRKLGRNVFFVFVLFKVSLFSTYTLTQFPYERMVLSPSVERR